jgi:hypothetical protein
LAPRLADDTSVRFQDIEDIWQVLGLERAAACLRR